MSPREPGLTDRLPARADLTVVGAGVVGLTLALAWKRRHPADDVVVLDKEPALGAHASGRNSGVLHAGLYYPPGTLKAQFARDGTRAWTRYCEERKLPLVRCGKLVVARGPEDHAGLDELLRRARGNDVPLESVDADQAHRIEPRAKTFERALHVPETAAMDPNAILAELRKDCAEAGVPVVLDCPWLGRADDDDGVRTGKGSFAGGTLVNAAGLFADRVAQAYGFGADVAILPFRGFYLAADRGTPPLACHIYPVPDLALPFLGVHVTVKADGGTTIGPTALPALWREHYGGLSGARPRDLLEVGTLGLRKLAADPSFRALARRELAMARRGPLLDAAEALVSGLDRSRWTRWGRSGIRAQLVDRSTGDLLMDFRTEGDRRSFHVLNAISPGFTCSLPFAEHCCDQMEALRA